VIPENANAELAGSASQDIVDRAVVPLDDTTPRTAINAPGAHEYVRHGWALVPIPIGEKGPVHKGWNRHEKCVTTSEGAAAIRGNVGLAHAFSGTAAIDIDDLAKATTWLAERGVDLSALLAEPDAVMISSGRPNRAKLLYRLAEPLISQKIVETVDGEPHSVIDFRCASATGATLQDVLPPSRHPEGRAYEWRYGDDVVGDWRHLPPMPDTLLSLWRGLIADHSVPSERPNPTYSLEQLREMVMRRDPDVDRDSWIADLAVLHWETRGSAEGLELAVEWSCRGKKFKGRRDVERCCSTYPTRKRPPPGARTSRRPRMTLTSSRCVNR
jgi:hypothetical protein